MKTPFAAAVAAILVATIAPVEPSAAKGVAVVARPVIVARPAPIAPKPSAPPVAKTTPPTSIPSPARPSYSPRTVPSVPWWMFWVSRPAVDMTDDCAADDNGVCRE